MNIIEFNTGIDNLISKQKSQVGNTFAVSIKDIDEELEIFLNVFGLVKLQRSTIYSVTISGNIYIINTKGDKDSFSVIFECPKNESH